MNTFVKTFFIAVVGMLVVACDVDLEEFTERLTNQAEDVIASYKSSDAAVVQECLNGIPECAADNTQGDVVCQVLETQCQLLGDNLAEVRAPAVDCWQDVIDCDNGDGLCEVQAKECDANDDGMYQNREPMIDCFGIVESCLVGTQNGEREDPAVCISLLSQCQKWAKWVIAVEVARFMGDSRANEMCLEAQDLAPVNWSCEFSDDTLDTAAEQDTGWSSVDDTAAEQDTGWSSVDDTAAELDTGWSIGDDTAAEADTGWSSGDDTPDIDTEWCGDGDTVSSDTETEATVDCQALGHDGTCDTGVEIILTTL